VYRDVGFSPQSLPYQKPWQLLESTRILLYGVQFPSPQTGYNAQGKLLAPLTKKQIKAVEKTFPPSRRLLDDFTV